jgi:hypothetical protein
MCQYSEVGIRYDVAHKTCLKDNAHYSKQDCKAGGPPPLKDSIPLCYYNIIVIRQLSETPATCNYKNGCLYIKNTFV